MTDHKQKLSADVPIGHPDQDMLGYSSFASLLSSSIKEMTTTDGIVLAINGEWGSGKTSTLKLIQHHLTKNTSSDEISILWFNPWWFSDREDLATKLLAQIGVLFGQDKNTKIKHMLSDFMKGVSKASFIPGAELGGFISLKLEESINLETMKEDIDKYLRSSDTKILIMIDDIDRLSPIEIYELFRTVKAVSNFSNILYLLSFDPEVVIRSLDEHFSGHGKDYLDKIVQVPFNLPLPDRANIRKMFTDMLDEIIVDTPDGLFDKNYWSNVFFKGVDPFLTTPRHVHRIINALRTTYPTIEGEVNPVDFIAIEVLRVCFPALYDQIRKHIDQLTGGVSQAFSFDTPENKRPLFDSWFTSYNEDQKGRLISVLSVLFPKFGASYEGMHYGSDFEISWRRDLRVCSSDIFPIFFRFDSESNSISASELRSLITLTGSRESFSEKLLQYSKIICPDGVSKARRVLERLEDFTKEDIQPDNISDVISSLFDIGEHLYRDDDEGSGIFSFSNEILIGRLIYQLVMRIPEQSRFQLLKSAIENASTLAVSVHEASLFSSQHGRHNKKESSPPHERVLTEEESIKLEEIVGKKINEFADAGNLINSPSLLYILYRWGEFADPDAPKKWVSEIITTDKDLAVFLSQFGFIQKSHHSGEAGVRKEYRLDSEHVSRFVDPASIAQSVRRILKDDSIEPKLRDACTEFLRTFELRNKGEEPYRTRS